MSEILDELAPKHEPLNTGFKGMHLMLGVCVILILITLASRWYAAQVSMPRYCQQPQQMLQYLEANMTQNRPAGDKSRRNYIIAAKLEFLVPRDSDEPLNLYLMRLQRVLEEECR